MKKVRSSKFTRGFSGIKAGDEEFGDKVFFLSALGMGGIFYMAVVWTTRAIASRFANFFWSGKFADPGEDTKNDEEEERTSSSWQEKSHKTQGDD
jgi:hypothetical protein